MRLFDRLEATLETSADESKLRRLLELEGAVLLHLEMAMKHDVDLAKAWLKRLREGTWKPTPFAFALSLVVSGTERLEQHVTAALRACLVKASNDAAKRASAPWLPADNSGSGRSAQASIEDALLTCARNAGHGQGTVVVQPLVNLAVALLEAEGAAGEKATAGHSMAAAMAAKDQGASDAGNLGIRVLVEIFAAHKECRKDVLALCSGRLAGASEAVAAPSVRLIAKLVRQHPILVESHLVEVRAALENLAALPQGAAIALLLALWPLCRARRDIADYVVMLLRKAMFSRELGCRLLAARGFLFIITEELLHGEGGAAAGGIAADAAGPSASQAIPALSQMDALAGGPGGATLLHELMGFLRRCLAQQPEVRMVVYDSLPALVSADPAVVEAVAELLLPHVASFVEHEENMAPLKLEACARTTPDGDVRVAEPLHCLLACMRCVIRSDPGAPSTVSDSDSEEEEDSEEDPGSSMDEDDAATPALRRLFASLRRRLASCPLEDFNFDQSTVFSSSEGQGMLNQAYAHMLIGCYEVMMEDVVRDIDGKGGAAPSPERSEALAEELLTLFHQHRRLNNLVANGMKGGGKAKKVEGLTQVVGGGRGGGGGGAGGGNKGQGISILGPFDHKAPDLSVHCLGRLLEAIVEDGLVPGGHHIPGSDQQSAHVKLARDVSVQTFIMTGCLRVLQSQGFSSTTQSHTLTALINSLAGVHGDGNVSSTKNTASEAMHTLFGVPDRQALAGPLFRAAQTTVLACARQHAPAAAMGGKKEKDPTAGLMQAAVAALDQFLASSGTTLPDLARILQPVALPAPTTTAAAGLPPITRGNENSPLAIVTSRLPHFKQLLDVLVEHSCSKEIISITKCLHTFCAVVPPQYAYAMANWLDAACAKAPEALSQHPTAVKELVSLQLKCHEAAGKDGDLTVLSRIGADLAECVEQAAGGDNNNIATLIFSAPPSNPLLTSKSLNAVILATAAHIDSSLGPLDWALVRLKPSGVNGEEGTFQEDGESDSNVAGALVQGHVRAQWEIATFKRLCGLSSAAAAITKVRVGAPGEALAKSLTKLYRTLGSAAKTQVAGRGQTQLPPGRPFQDLANAVNTVLTPAVYELKGELQLTTNAAMEKDEQEEEVEDDENEDGNEEAKKNKGKSKAKRAAAVRKAQKDARVLPGLIFQLEEWEKHLIKVSKVGKINLMLNAKRATNWDFRIKGDQVAAAAKRQRVEVPELAAPYEEQEEEEVEADQELMDADEDCNAEIGAVKSEKRAAERPAQDLGGATACGGGFPGIAVEDAFDEEENADGFYDV